MPEWQWVTNTGLAVAALYFVGRWLAKKADLVFDTCIDKLLPLGNRYVTSTENLHDSLKDNLSRQQAFNDQHATASEVMHEEIARNSVAWKHVASSLCKGCREVMSYSKPSCADIVLRHCDEIERIIGEA